jgi:hypothetical protein
MLMETRSIDSEVERLLEIWTEDFLANGQRHAMKIVGIDDLTVAVNDLKKEYYSKDYTAALETSGKISGYFMYFSDFVETTKVPMGPAFRARDIAGHLYGRIAKEFVETVFGDKVVNEEAFHKIRDNEEFYFVRGASIVFMRGTKLSERQGRKYRTSDHNYRMVFDNEGRIKRADFVKHSPQIDERALMEGDVYRIKSALNPRDA